MPDDPFAAYGGHAVSATPTTSPTDDPFAAYGGRSVSAPTPAPVSPPSPEPAASSDPFAAFGGVSTSSPTNGQEPSTAPTHLYQDSSQPFYKRAWDWANTPLTESLFGLPEHREGAGGFERGVENILSGLTSPLSVALTAATFGGGGLLESVGANVLRESGEFTAEQIPQIIKATETALQAGKDLKPIEPAINEALVNGGHDLDLLRRAKEATGPLNLETEFGGPAYQQATANAAGETQPGILERLGFNPEERKALAKMSDTIAQTKEGFKPVEEAIKAQGLDPSLFNHALDVLDKNGLTANDLVGGNALERGSYQILRKTVPTMSVASTARAAKTANAILNAGFTYQQLESAAALSPRFLDALKEGDYDHAVEYGTEALAGGLFGIAGASHALESWGELTKPLIENNKFRPNDQWLAIQRANQEREANHVVGEQQAIKLDNTGRDLIGHEAPRAVLGDAPEVKSQKQLELASVFHQVVTGGNQNKAAAWYNALSEAAGKNDRLRTIALPKSGIPEVDEAANKYATLKDDFLRDNKSVKMKDLLSAEDDLKKALDKNKMGRNNPVWSAVQVDANRDLGLSDNLSHQIESNNFSKLPESYQNLVLDSLKRVANGELSDKETAAAKFLADENAKNFQIGLSNDLLHEQIKGYLHRVYKDENPEGKVVLSNAKQGKFSTNVSMARQRVYDSHITALLKSPKEIEFDPIKVTAQDREQLIKAAANKQLMDHLLSHGIVGSDKRPAAILSGSGQVIQGTNGEDPRTFILPNRVRDIRVSDQEIQAMKQSGDFDRFLEDGTLKEMTPSVNPSNINQMIDRLEQKGISQEAQYDPEGNNILRKQIDQLKDIRDNKKWDELPAFNESLPRSFAWDPQDYITVNNGAMRGWNFVVNDPSGNPVFVRSDIRVHPEFAEYLKNRLGLEGSDLQKHPVSRALLKTGTKLKETLLSLSPFHLAQEALRGIMVGVNPFHITGPDILSGERVDPADPNSPTIIRKAVEHGFTPGTDYKSLQDHSEGVASGGGLLRKIPGVGHTIANSMDWYQNFLFKRYIPALKARAVEHMFREYQRLNPDWSVDRVAKAAALHTNDTFGGINWKAMGRSATTQDWGRLFMLAPDWAESEFRSAARLFNGEEGGLGRAQVAKMTLGLWGLARVLNLVTTGKPHLEAPFGLAYKNKEGKELVYSIRTLPTDILHAASDPVGFIKGRLSPTVQLGTELITQRDRYGRKLAPEDVWVDAFRQMMPIPVQSVGQVLSGTGPEVGNAGQLYKAIGGTATSYQTPAQKMAADLAANHTEDGPIDPSKMARHRMVMHFEDQVRSGEMSWPDLMRLTYQTDQIHPDELRKIQQNITKTKGMDPSMASLYSRASRLPAAEYLQLYQTMNPSERAALAPLTVQVQKRYLNKAKKDETPEERAKDPVFQQFLRMIPSASPQ